MKNILGVIALCGVLFMAKPAMAEGLLTSTQLYSDCKSVLNDSPFNPQGTVDGTYCNGYMSGFLNAMNMEQSANNKWVFCSPAASTFMLAKMYVDYIDKNPKLLSETPESSVVYFLINSFPCQK